MEGIRYAIDGPQPSPEEIGDLRESVGWVRDEAFYERCGFRPSRSGILELPPHG